MLMGAGTGALIGWTTYAESPGGFVPPDFGPGGNAVAGSIVGLLPGLFIGTAIGASSREKDEIYNMTNKTVLQKVEILKDIIYKKNNGYY